MSTTPSLRWRASGLADKIVAKAAARASGANGSLVALRIAPLIEGKRAMIKRPRFKQRITLQDRLKAWADQVRAEAALLPPGPERDAMFKRARQVDTTSNVDDRVNPPGPRSPS